MRRKMALSKEDTDDDDNQSCLRQVRTNKEKRNLKISVSFSRHTISVMKEVSRWIFFLSLITLPRRPFSSLTLIDIDLGDIQEMLD